MTLDDLIYKPGLLKGGRVEPLAGVVRRLADGIDGDLEELHLGGGDRRRLDEGGRAVHWSTPAPCSRTSSTR